MKVSGHCPVSSKVQSERRVMRPLILGTLVGGILVGVGAAAAERPVNTPRMHVDPVADVEDPLAWIEGPMDCGRIESKIRSRYGLGVESENALQPLLREEFRFVKEETCTNTKYGSCGFVWCGESAPVKTAARAAAAPATTGAAAEKKNVAVPPASVRLGEEPADIGIEDILAEETAQLEAGKREAKLAPAKAEPRAALRNDMEIDAILEESDPGHEGESFAVAPAAPLAEESAEESAAAAPVAVEEIAPEPVAAHAPVAAEPDMNASDLDAALDSPEGELAEADLPLKGAPKQAAEPKDFEQYAALLPAGTKGFVRKEGAFVPVPFVQPETHKESTSLAQLDRERAGNGADAAAEAVAPVEVEEVKPAVVPVANIEPARLVAPKIAAPAVAAAVVAPAVVAPAVAEVKPSVSVPVADEVAKTEIGGEESSIQTKYAELLKRLADERDKMIASKKYQESRKQLAWVVIKVPGANARLSSSARAGAAKPEQPIVGANGVVGRSITPGIGRNGDVPASGILVTSQTNFSPQPLPARAGGSPMMQQPQPAPRSVLIVSPPSNGGGAASLAVARQAALLAQEQKQGSR